MSLSCINGVDHAYSYLSYRPLVCTPILLPSDTPRLRTHVFRLPMSWSHNCPRRLQKTACDNNITDAISPHCVCVSLTRYDDVTQSLVDTANHPAPSDTQRLRKHVFRSRWHGAAQTHFPPRPRKAAWHSDITDVYNFLDIWCCAMPFPGDMRKSLPSSSKDLSLFSIHCLLIHLDPASCDVTTSLATEFSSES